MPDPLKEALEKTIERLRAASAPVDVDSALGYLKSVSEIEKNFAERESLQADVGKAAIESAIAKRQLRNTLLTSLFGLLVPITSLLTVVVSLYIGSQQLRSAQDAAERKLADDRGARADAGFNDLMRTIESTSADNLYENGTFVARLRLYSNDPNRDLSDVTQQFMIRLSSSSAFQSMWHLTFKEVTDKNVEKVVALARRKKTDFDVLLISCAAETGENPAAVPSKDDRWGDLGDCSPTISPISIARKYADQGKTTKILSLKSKMTELASMHVFLTAQIAAYLRTHSNKSTGPKSVDLSNIYLTNGDFENVDFSLANLTATAFSYCSVKNAVLLPKGTTVDFRGTPWWEAEKVDTTMLPWLIKNAFPNNPAVYYRGGASISRNEYEAALKRLCDNKLPICQNACLRFGSDSPSDPNACKDGQ